MLLDDDVVTDGEAEARSLAGGGLYSMYYFARHIAAGEIFPSLAFGFEPLDPTVLIRHLPVPECAKRTIR
jgi:hypothetical protein